MSLDYYKDQIMEKCSKKETGYDTPDTSSIMSSHSKSSIPSTPPPPYFKTRFVPLTFKGAVNIKFDKSSTSLFRLSTRLLQFSFGMASGISYAIELNHRYSAETTNFIYAQVVFGVTLITLIVDSVTVRHYRFVWLFEYLMAVLWFACFGLFYNVYIAGEVDAAYAVVDLGRMKGAVWCDLINALLWLATGLFSTVMCCSGTKAAIKGKLERRRQRKVNGELVEDKTEGMETGTIGRK